MENAAETCRLWACGMMCLREGEGLTSLDRVRNDDICESLGRVEVIGVMNEKEEELEREAKGNELRQTW